jgi:hypothetical protein
MELKRPISTSNNASEDQMYMKSCCVYTQKSPVYLQQQAFVKASSIRLVGHQIGYIVQQVHFVSLYTHPSHWSAPSPVAVL